MSGLPWPDFSMKGRTLAGDHPAMGGLAGLQFDLRV
jgi:hypothetical protein